MAVSSTSSTGVLASGEIAVNQAGDFVGLSYTEGDDEIGRLADAQELLARVGEEDGGKAVPEHARGARATLPNSVTGGDIILYKLAADYFPAVHQPYSRHA